MKRTFLLLIAMALFLVSNAQETKVPSKNKPSQDLENLQLAYQLAKYGYNTFSATSMIEAARIMSTVSTQELNYETYKHDSIPKNQATKQSKEGYDLASILAAAKKYAGDDSKLLSSIAAIEKANQPTRGRVGGPGEKYSYVYGKSGDVFDISFIEGELAEILVFGDGDTDLDLYVWDSNGNLIAKDIDYTDRCYVSWVPMWTGRYKVRIFNNGPIINNYHLLTN